jgi:hypothetical protein
MRVLRRQRSWSCIESHSRWHGTSDEAQRGHVTSCSTAECCKEPEAALARRRQNIRAQAVELYMSVGTLHTNVDYRKTRAQRILHVCWNIRVCSNNKGDSCIAGVWRAITHVVATYNRREKLYCVSVTSRALRTEEVQGHTIYWKVTLSAHFDIWGLTMLELKDSDTTIDMKCYCWTFH